MYVNDWLGPKYDVVRSNPTNWYAVARPMPNVLCYQMHGHLDAHLADKIIQGARPLLNQRAPLHLFHDWWDMTGYDAESRVQLTDFVAKNSRLLGETHVLVRSPLVVVGVSTANMVLRQRLRAFKDQEGFLQAYQAMMQPSSAVARG